MFVITESIMKRRVFFKDRRKIQRQGQPDDTKMLNMTDRDGLRFVQIKVL
jgi:hypothetical protein